MRPAAITLLLIFWLFPVPAYAAIGISPVRLDFDLVKETAQTQKIFLQNLGDSPHAVRMRLADQKSSGFVRISPSELVLEPRAVTPVQITVLRPIPLDTQLEITEFLIPSGSLGVAGGLKIPISVRVLGSSAAIWKLIVSALFAGLVTFSVFMILKKRFKPN